MGRLCTGIGILSLLAIPAVASADPVSFTYQINVTQRCDLRGCGPYTAAFPLTLSFDSAVTGSSTEPDLIVRYYGAPTFSSVPLDRPVVIAGASDNGRTVDMALYQPPIDWRRVAHASQVAQVSTVDYEYTWVVSINETQDFLAATPELSAESFGAFLGSGRNPSGFLYKFFGIDRMGGLSPETVEYVGSAQLQEQSAPVPEPMSLLLTGTGLAAIGARARRRNRGDRPLSPSSGSFAVKP